VESKGALRCFSSFFAGSPIEQYNSIGEKGAARVRDFVHRGGGFVGVCAGAFLGAVNSKDVSFGLRLLPVSFVPSVLKSTEELCGVIEVSVDLNPLKMRYRNGPLFAQEELKKHSDVAVIGVVTECSAMPKQFRSKMIRKSCIVAGKFGKGHVVLCGPHPEVSKELDEFTWSLFEIAFGWKEE
jgi:glutamine amidotransferase-like uncharacterized protein